MNDISQTRWSVARLAAHGPILLCMHLTLIGVVLHYEVAIYLLSFRDYPPRPLLLGVLGFDGMVGYAHANGLPVERYGGNTYLWVFLIFGLLFGGTHVISALGASHRRPHNARDL